MSIKIKLIGSMVVLLLVMLLSISYGYVAGQSIINSTSYVEEVTFPALDDATLLFNIVAETRDLIKTGYEEMDKDMIDDIRHDIHLFNDVVVKIMKSGDGERIRSIQMQYEEYCQNGIALIETYYDTEDALAVADMVAQIVPVASQLQKGIKEYRSAMSEDFAKTLGGIREYSKSY
ncbi:MAG: hypothetical protein HQL32_13800, partial [Planctomycetes bacterium]|nr:hypothetical protein [Planctomycetota bacterium]